MAAAPGSDPRQPPLNAVPSAAAHDAYMATMTRLFGDDLVAIGAGDARPQMQRLLVDAVEAGFAVYGDPVRQPDDSWVVDTAAPSSASHAA